MGNLAGFNADEVPEQRDFGALPPDRYVSVVTASEWKTTKTGGGKYLQLDCEVIDGQHVGRKFWDRLNLDNPNQSAVDIAQRALGALCRAVGVPKPQDSSELHNKPFLATLDIEIDDRKRESNTVRKYEAASASAQHHAPANTGTTTTAAPAADKTPPWKKS